MLRGFLFLVACGLSFGCDAAKVAMLPLSLGPASEAVPAPICTTSLLPFAPETIVFGMV